MTTSSPFDEYQKQIEKDLAAALEQSMDDCMKPDLRTRLNHKLKVGRPYAIFGGLFGAAAAFVCKSIGVIPDVVNTATQSLDLGIVFAGAVLGSAIFAGARMAHKKAGRLLANLAISSSAAFVTFAGMWVSGQKENSLSAAGAVASLASMAHSKLMKRRDRKTIIEVYPVTAEAELVERSDCREAECYESTQTGHWVEGRVMTMSHLPDCLLPAHTEPLPEASKPAKPRDSQETVIDGSINVRHWIEARHSPDSLLKKNTLNPDLQNKL